MNLKRHLSYAQGYLELGLVAEATEELQRIPATEQETEPVLALWMAVLNEKQDWPALASLAARAIRKSAGEPAVWVTWAYAVRRAESVEAAERILLEGELHHPNDPTIQFNLGCYASLRGDLAQAQRRVDRAVALDPKFIQAAAEDPDLAPLRQANLKRGKKRES